MSHAASSTVAFLIITFLHILVGEFAPSAKTVWTGSLLADDIAARLNHPELATWIMDWPNPDDRARDTITHRGSFRYGGRLSSR